jgi:hypothetical protein
MNIALFGLAYPGSQYITKFRMKDEDRNGGLILGTYLHLGAEMYKLQWNELNPVVTYVNYIKCQPGFQFGPRFIFEHQFVYIAKGKGVGIFKAGFIL